MENFSKIYNQIKDSDKSFAVGYYKKTNITINENNIEHIIFVEKNKLKNLENFYDIDKYLEKFKIGDEYLIIDVYLFNKNNIEDYKKIEKMKNFHSWL